MGRHFHLSLTAVFALSLAACIPAVVPGTPTVDCGERWVCKCVNPILVEAWSDRNGNGNRDPEDAPLEGVGFRLQWVEDTEPCSTPYVDSYYLVTDATGHDFYELGGCSCGTEVIEPETPAGYRLTAPSVVGCLFDAPSSYVTYSIGSFCRSYGFTPIAP